MPDEVPNSKHMGGEDVNLMSDEVQKCKNIDGEDFNLMRDEVENEAEEYVQKPIPLNYIKAIYLEFEDDATDELKDLAKKAGVPLVTGDRRNLEPIEEGKRIPRKKGQPAGSKKHSDLYTDENPKGTIHGLKFATVKDAEASVNKIKNSGKKHAHKIQAAIAMEQRAREMGKNAQAAVYRAYINKMKKKTKERNAKS